MKAKYISIILSLVVFLNACTKLHDKDYGGIISENFKPNESDIVSLVGVPYANWRNLQLGRSANSIWRTNEISSDEAIIPKRPNGWVDGGIYKRVFLHKWTADEDNSAQIWNNAYSGITNCNRLLFQINENLIPVDETTKVGLIAEIKVLRASFYYPLIDFFGNVPIVTDFDVPEGFEPEQSTRKDVYSFIISELKENIPLLTRKKDNSTYGRFNKWAGYALLARMYLEGEVYSGEPHWKECIDACDSVINSKLYSLANNQSDVFAIENSNSDEIIFAIPFDKIFTADGNTAFTMHMETLQPENQATYDFENSPWGGICATPQFINTFDPDDKRLQDNWVQGQQFTSSGDTLYGTMGPFTNRPLRYVNEVPSIDSSEEVHGFRLGKFEIEHGGLVGMSNDFPLFRYAGVLMTKAEALLRSGIDDNEAANLVSEVRGRSFASDEKADVTASQLKEGSVYDYGMRETGNTTHEGGSDVKFGRLLDELGWEFNQEGRRRQDMIRFGIFTKKSWLSHSPNGDYRSLLPIPTSALQTNPNLKQNPGYPN